MIDNDKANKIAELISGEPAGFWVVNKAWFTGWKVLDEQAGYEARWQFAYNPPGQDCNIWYTSMTIPNTPTDEDLELAMRAGFEDLMAKVRATLPLLKEAE